MTIEYLDLRRRIIETGGGGPHTHPESDVVNLPTDLNGKAPVTHNHTESDVENLVTDLAGKAPSAHSHAESDVTNLETDLAGKADVSHTHTEAQVTNLVTDLAGKEPANANIQAHVTSAHAPANAQKNSDILKSEIEAVLTGLISSHSHAGSGGSSELWEGKVHINMLDGNPMAEPFMAAATNTTISPTVTPTNIGATIGRIAAFRFKMAIVITSIRWYGIAAVAGIYTAAIYRDSDGARLWNPGAISTAANAWSNNTAGGLPISLAADTLYWFGISANATGTTAGFCTPPVPRQQSWGLATPAWAGLTTIGLRYCQVALTAGAWPATLPTKVNAAAWTGFIPIFWLCASGF
jgi:hypothetical protein